MLDTWSMEQLSNFLRGLPYFCRFCFSKFWICLISGFICDMREASIEVWSSDTKAVELAREVVNLELTFESASMKPKVLFMLMSLLAWLFPNEGAFKESFEFLDCFMELFRFWMSLVDTPVSTKALRPLFKCFCGSGCWMRGECSRSWRPNLLEVFKVILSKVVSFPMSGRVRMLTESRSLFISILGMMSSWLLRPFSFFCWCSTL
mmetsp:Transcript_23976/g.36783  ORF Transcript_23976/g.36783 Transcript_23976/m.36783 type:complete len:206 (+) Transcript_23976:487-1104(+)